MDDDQNISPTTKKLGLASHLVLWAFILEWFFELTASFTHVVVLVLFLGWSALRTLWYRRMSAEGAIGVSWSEAIAAFVFVGCAVGLMLIPLGAPLAAFATPLKAVCALSAIYVIGRGVARGIQQAQEP